MYIYITYIYIYMWRSSIASEGNNIVQENAWWDPRDPLRTSQDPWERSIYTILY